MEEFLRKFTQLNGVEARVVLKHRLFDGQRFYCRQLKTIDDNERIGVLIKDREIYLDKHNVKVAEVQENTYVLSDGRLTITINVNKL